MSRVPDHGEGVKIKFWNVGHGKWCGTIQAKEGADLDLVVLREAKKHLASKGIDLDPPDGSAPGLIFAGGREVGYYKYEA